MSTTPLSSSTLDGLRLMQQEEVDSHAIYLRVAATAKDENRRILERIAADELAHSKFWQNYTGATCEPSRLRVWFFALLARTLGFTFTVKLLEKKEVGGRDFYTRLEPEVPEIAKVREDEARHEQELIGMLDEERLRFVGSMVLGMNDALVELTGALAGFSFALRSTRLVALAGLITGISATLSMTSSSYLSAKAEEDPDALKSSLYTGFMYLVTVGLMSLPFLVLPNDMVFWALGAMSVVVVAIIAGFNFYIAVAKGLGFRRRFLEMLVLCVVVTGVSFAIGSLVKKLLGIDLG
jgi:VIT1/CCC1 family predicted Fe2+/Mn2+ transporter